MSEKKKRNVSLKFNLDEEKIIKLYVEDKKTILEIAKLFNVNHGTIKKRLIKNNIEIRSHKENQLIVMNRPEVKETVSKASIKSNDKRMQTNLERYGSVVASNGKEINEKWKAEHLKKYGVEHPTQREEIKDKYKNTCLDKYGVDNASKSDEVKDKIKENRWENKTDEELKEIREKTVNSYIEKFGCDNPLKNKEVKNKMRQNNLKKYGVEWISQREDIKKRIKESNKIKSEEIKEILRLRKLNNFINNSLNKLLNYLDLKLDDKEFIDAHHRHNWKCLKCENIFDQTWNEIKKGYNCPICYPRNQGYSKGEKELLDFIKSLNIENIIENDRNILNGLELDILIPGKNIAIEFDGLYYHSDKFNKDECYHLNKTDLCLDKNINLIHIFEDEWINKRKIVENKLKEILNIYDNELIDNYIIREINDEDNINQFLNEYHLLEEYNSDINLGLFNDDNELISIMSFNKINNNFELTRYCYKYYNPDFFNKLFNYFINNYNFEIIYLYDDRRYSNINFYLDLGFELDKIIEPKYWYIDGLNRCDDDLINDNIFNKIWDCGYFKYIFKQ